MRTNKPFGNYLSLVCVVLATSLGCTSSKNQVENTVVLQVNDRKLTVHDFSERLARKLRNFDALSAKDPGNLLRSKDDIVRQFIMESLVQDYALIKQISVQDQELNKEVNDIRSSYPDDVSFRNVLAEENISFANWQEQLRMSILQKKVFNSISTESQAKKVSAKENDLALHKLYDENKERYRRKERIYLRQIVTDDLGKANDLKEAIKKKDFASIATKFSVSPEAKNGGLVGWIEKGSVDIFDKAFLLPPGGVSQVLESSYGFHILKVEKKAPAGFATFEEVKPVLEQTLSAQREQADYTAWLDKQIRASRVFKNNELIRAIVVDTKLGTKVETK